MGRVLVDYVVKGSGKSTLKVLEKWFLLLWLDMADPEIIDGICGIFLYADRPVHRRSPFLDKMCLFFCPDRYECFTGDRTYFADDPFPHLLVNQVKFPCHDHDPLWNRFNVPRRNRCIDPHRFFGEQSLFYQAPGEEGIVIVVGERRKPEIPEYC